LINDLIRDAVKEEINEAKRRNIPIYTFIKNNDARSSIASEFICELQKAITTTNYSTMDDLAKKIEDSLLLRLRIRSVTRQRRRQNITGQN
jgi:hypothetical protein